MNKKSKGQFNLPQFSKLEDVFKHYSADTILQFINPEHWTIGARRRWGYQTQLWELFDRGKMWGNLTNSNLAYEVYQGA